MYEDHELLRTPDDPESTIWRYTDLVKLLDLLEREALWFTSAAFMDDRFEGSLTFLNTLINEIDPTITPKAKAAITEASSYSPRWAYLNCWHMSEHESAAMWSLYSGRHGLAIASSFRRLATSINDEGIVHIGMVNYLDYSFDIIDPSNIFFRFVSKRKSYEHERELRAISLVIPTDDEGTSAVELEKRSPSPVGLSVSVDPKVLIESVRVAPQTPPWQTDVVATIVNRLLPEVPVLQSELDQDPLY
jgi:hypothetical protein